MAVRAAAAARSTVPVARAAAAPAAPQRSVLASPAAQREKKDQQLATSTADAVAKDPTQLPRLVKLVEDNPHNLAAAFELVKLLDGTNSIPRDDERVVKELSRLIASQVPGAVQYAMAFARREHNVDLGIQLLDAGHVDVVQWLMRGVVDISNHRLLDSLRRHAVENMDFGLLASLVRMAPTFVEAVYAALDRVPVEAENPAGSGAGGAAAPGDNASAAGVADADASDAASDAGSIVYEDPQVSAFQKLIAPLETLATELLRSALPEQNTLATELLQEMARRAPPAYVPKFIIDAVLYEDRERVEAVGGAPVNHAVIKAFAQNMLRAAAHLAGGPGSGSLSAVALMVADGAIGQVLESGQLDEALLEARTTAREYLHELVLKLPHDDRLVQAVKTAAEQWNVPALRDIRKSTKAWCGCWA